MPPALELELLLGDELLFEAALLDAPGVEELELLFPGLEAELLLEFLPPVPEFACRIRLPLGFVVDALELALLLLLPDDALLFEAVLLDAPGVEELGLL